MAAAAGPCGAPDAPLPRESERKAAPTAFSATAAASPPPPPPPPGAAALARRLGVFRAPSHLTFAWRAPGPCPSRPAVRRWPSPGLCASPPRAVVLQSRGCATQAATPAPPAGCTCSGCNHYRPWAKHHRGAARVPRPDPARGSARSRRGRTRHRGSSTERLRGAAPWPRDRFPTRPRRCVAPHHSSRRTPAQAGRHQDCPPPAPIHPRLAPLPAVPPPSAVPRPATPPDPFHGCPEPCRVATPTTPPYLRRAPFPPAALRSSSPPRGPRGPPPTRSPRRPLAPQHLPHRPRARPLAEQGRTCVSQPSFFSASC